jgi:hypothetical protein
MPRMRSPSRAAAIGCVLVAITPACAVPSEVRSSGVDSPSPVPSVVATHRTHPLGLLPSRVLDSGEVCKKPNAKPPPREYIGLLRGVVCEQQMFLTMANVAKQLGVECNYCHVSKADGKLDYPVMTPRKETANWMAQHFMQALRPKADVPFRCSTCHVDAKGKPVAKILGQPRDIVRTNEWMMLTMVGQFETPRGEPLKCRSCHVANYSTPAWHAKVILQSGQIPAHESP